LSDRKSLPINPLSADWEEGFELSPQAQGRTHRMIHIDLGKTDDVPMQALWKFFSDVAPVR
jgi:hypothetical protein